MVNVVPFPTALSKVSVPPCLSTTMDRAMASPSAARSLLLVGRGAQGPVSVSGATSSMMWGSVGFPCPYS